MDRDQFRTAAGTTLTHFTPVQNVRGIKALGLMPPATLARRARIDPATLTLRSAPIEISLKGHVVHLNHQRPLLAGRKTAYQFLDGHTLQSWAAQLDTRIFLWRDQQGDAFSLSLPEGIHRFELDTGLLYDLYSDHIWLSPINSGSAMRRAAVRGDWLYVSATASLREFRRNRRTVDRKFFNDRIKEISLTCAIPPDTLKRICR